MCKYIDPCNNGYNMWMKKSIPIYVGPELENLCPSFIKKKTMLGEYNAKLGFDCHNKYFPKKYIYI